MFTYSQVDGWLYHDGRSVGKGYAGKGPGLNNPRLQNIKGVGPLPQGHYDILAPVDSKEHGPYAMVLDPHEDNEMFSREGMMLHGDNPKGDHSASSGCIVMPRWVRDFVWSSGDHLLQVVEHYNV